LKWFLKPITNISDPSFNFPPPCTPPPAINSSSIEVGSNKTVTGTWNRLDATKPATASISLYKNGSLAGTTTATTGAGWNIAGINIASGDVFYAKALSTGESECLQSSSIKALGCNSTNTSTTTGLTFSCFGSKGMEGGRPANATVKIYFFTTSGITLLADDNSTTYLITYPSSTTWRYDAANGQGNPSACSGGANDVSDGQYAITATEAGKCESKYVFNCLALSAQAAPTISQTVLYAGNTTVSGTVSVSNSLVRLFRNGVFETSMTASGTSYSFNNLTLNSGDVVEVTAQATGQCMSTAASRTVFCYTTPPVINTTPGGNLIAGASAISGTSGEAAGTTVTVFENGISIGTTSVLSTGSWSLTYTVISGRNYHATQQVSGCSASAQSATAGALAATTDCPTITGSYNENSSSVIGTMPSAFTGTIRLYMDGTLITSTVMSGGTNWSIAVNQNTTTYIDKLYAGAVLTVSAQASGAAEKTDCGSTVTVSCATPVTPVISPTIVSINAGQTVSFTVQNAQAGMLFSIRDDNDAGNLGISKFGNGSDLSLITSAFNTAGSYTIRIKSTSFSGPSCEAYATASIFVMGTLPAAILSFNAKYQNNEVMIRWKTASEENVSHYEAERSGDGRNFYTIGTVMSGNYSSVHEYSFTDRDPGYQRVYYRLKVVDADGRVQYSKIVAVHLSSQFVIEKITPNPFRENLKVEISSRKDEWFVFRITDLAGRELFRETHAIRQGKNVIHIRDSKLLASGVYMLRIETETEKQGYRVVKH
jgi:hypothetical protein